MRKRFEITLGIAAALMLGAAPEARAATIGWVDFSSYVVGAQSQSGLSSPSGLQVDASFSNLDNFNTVEFPSPAPFTAAIADPSWPFQNVIVPGLSVVPEFLGSGPPISTQLTFQFTNPGGLAAGGSLSVMDLEDFGATVMIAGLSGGVAVPVTWTFASYSVQGNNVSPPVWNPLTQTLHGPRRAANLSGFPNNFALLTSDRQLDEVVLTISMNEGAGFGVGQVPEPGTGLLVTTGVLGLAASRRRRAN